MSSEKTWFFNAAISELLSKLFSEVIKSLGGGLWGAGVLKDLGQLRAFGRRVEAGRIIGQRLRPHEIDLGDLRLELQRAQLVGAVHGEQREDDSENHQHGQHQVQK